MVMMDIEACLSPHSGGDHVTCGRGQGADDVPGAMCHADADTGRIAHHDPSIGHVSSRPQLHSPPGRGKNKCITFMTVLGRDYIEQKLSLSKHNGVGAKQTRDRGRYNEKQGRPLFSLRRAPRPK